MLRKNHTDSTEQVANIIAKATREKLFEVESVEPYTEENLDWWDYNSCVFTVSAIIIFILLKCYNSD